VNLPGFHKALDALAPRIDRLPGMGRIQDLDDYLSASEVRALEDRFRESNGRLEKSRELGLTGFGYALP
jgi:hypothetical protein